ncbi:MAG: prolipoprotein diacylglyceryl transferase [Lachnospiraceae bacterium]|nr:prolipoprotein diacylglyceryl transferase [Lachnospiraceae bacterium]
MGVNDIAFPNLNIYLENVPKSFTVFGGFSIALYGVVIGLGMLLCVLTAAYDRKSRGLNPDELWDCALYGIIFGVIGARIYYVIFAWDIYKDDLLQIFNTRGGGLAIYGGVIGGFLTVFIYTKVKKISFLEMADSVALVFPLGQAIGRWGNFFNREAFGGWCENLLAMRLPLAAVRASDVNEEIMSHVVSGMDYIQVHPTFLYESIWNAILFIGLFLYRKHKAFPGEVFMLYLFFYGLGRFFIEALRTDQLLMPYISFPVSRIVAAVCMVLSVSVCIFMRFRERKDKV